MASDELRPRYHPNDLRDFFQRVSTAGVSTIILGGQAVNLHVLAHAREIPNIESLGAFTSFDLDFHGGMQEAKAIIKVLKPRSYKINDGHGDVNQAGVMICALDKGEIVVDVLAHLLGVSGDRIQQNPVYYDDVPLPVIHPITCLISKTHNLAKLPQEGRQDKRHLQLMILVCQVHLFDQREEPRYVLNQAEALFHFVRTAEAREVYGEHGINILDAIPIARLQQVSDPKIQIFLEKRWPQMLQAFEEVNTKFER